MPLLFLKPSAKILESLNKVIKHVYGKDISEMSLDEFRGASHLASLDGKFFLDDQRKIVVFMAANAAFLEEDVRRYASKNMGKTDRNIAESSMKWLRRVYSEAERYFYAEPISKELCDRILHTDIKTHIDTPED